MSVDHWDFTGVDQVRALRNGSELTRPILILTTDDADSLQVLQRDIPELQRWQPHPTELGFFVEEFSANRILGTLWWEGSVRWSNTINRSPLDQPVKLLGVRTETLPSATVRNSQGNLILNTAGDIVTPIDKPERIRIFTFQKNLPGLAQWLFDYEDVVNANSVRIDSQNCDRRTLLLRKVEFSEEDEVDGVLFRVCTLEVAYRKSTWLHRFPSTGWNQLVEEQDYVPGSATFGQSRLQRRPILINGQPPAQEQLLDADGKWIEQPEPSDLVLLEEDLFPEVDFSALPLS